MRAVQISEFGGPEVLQVVDVPDPVADGPVEVFDVAAAGINFADTHRADDSYLARQSLPMVPGSEVVVRRPDGTRLLALVASGGYAERIALDPTTALAVPER